MFVKYYVFKNRFAIFHVNYMMRNIYLWSASDNKAITYAKYNNP